MIVTVYSNDDSLNWNATGTERIMQNVKNLIRTRPFEVPFMRDMGLNPDYIDAETQKIKTECLNYIEKLISEYEPRATVVDVRVDSIDENGDYVIAVELEV